MAIGDRCGHCFPVAVGTMTVKWLGEKTASKVDVKGWRQCSAPSTQEEIIPFIHGDLVVINCEKHALAVRAVELAKAIEKIKVEKAAEPIDKEFG